MKICLFADAQSVHIQQLAPGLVREGHAVHVLTHKPASIPGVRVEHFHVPQASPLNLRRWPGRMTHYLHGFFRNFDVVNIHFLQDWGLRFDTLPPDGAALVATAWGSDIVDPPGETAASAELTRVRRSLLRRADAVTACGPKFAATVAEYADLNANRVEVLPFGVDLHRFHKRGEQAVRSRPPYRVGFFKGFRPVYGPTCLVRAIPRVLQRMPEVTFELAGDGAQLDECRVLASELGIQANIQWTPRLPHDDIPKFLARCDLTAIPSVHEAFGVAALESSAMGVAVVASDVGGLKDTVRHGETGLLVRPNDPQALADGIVALLLDADLRRKMADAGREVVESEFDWSRLHRRWSEFYERVRESACVMA